MLDWKCEKCEKLYSIYELMKLINIPLGVNEKHSKEQHGFTPVCSCGYRFYLDKFVCQDTIEIMVDGAQGIVILSTVFLELDHFGYWYETMLFASPKSKVGFDLSFQKRTKTRIEAQKLHKEVLEKLEHRRFKLKPHRDGVDIILEDE